MATDHSLGGHLGGGRPEDRWLPERDAPAYCGRERPLEAVLKTKLVLRADSLEMGGGGGCAAGEVVETKDNGQQDPGGACRIEHSGVPQGFWCGPW